MSESAPAPSAGSAVADRLRHARGRRFVGREAELELVRGALEEAEPSFTVGFVHGPGGVGKTALLRAVEDLAREAGARPARLDLRDELLPRLPAPTLVLIAGRDPPAPGWMSDPGWRELLRVVALRNLAPPDTCALLAAEGVAEDLHPALLALTHGHPLALALLVDVLRQRGDMRPPGELAAAPDVVRALVERFVASVPSTQHRRALAVVAHARTTTEGMLRSALAVEDAGDILAWLRGLSFIDDGERGRARGGAGVRPRGTRACRSAGHRALAGGVRAGRQAGAARRQPPRRARAQPAARDESIVASRPLIETVVRRRLARSARVEIVERCDAAGLIAEDGHVTGVRLLRRAPGSAEERVAADLVVAATGRGGRLGAWVQALGHPAPAEERLDVDIAYVSRGLALEPGALGDDLLVLFGARPGVPRTLALFAQEHGRWLLTLGGFHGNHPPRDRAGMLAFAATVAPPDVVAAVASATELDEPVAFRFPASKRRRYRDLPRRLLPLGDAVCAFNPIYGQGMTVAALQAVALRDALRGGLDGAERRFRGRAERAIDQAWELAAGADLAQPCVPGRRSPRVRAVNAYLRRLFAAAEHDEELAVAFLRVSSMTDPAPALLRPSVIRRVLRPGPAVSRGADRLLQVDGVRTPRLEAGPRDAGEAGV